MPVKIGSFEPLSEEEFTALRRQKARKTDPAMVALLAEGEAGRPVRLPLVEGQGARGLRTAISRAATSRGLTVETVEGTGSWRCGRPTSRAPGRGGRHLRRKGSDGEAGHPSVRSKTRPRSNRCGIWRRGRARCLGRPFVCTASRRSPGDSEVCKRLIHRPSCQVGEADEIWDALTMLIGQGFGDGSGGLGMPGTQGPEEAPWTEAEITQLWGGFTPNAQRIVAEIARRPDGYPTAALEEAVGLDMARIGGSLSSVGHNMKRLFWDGNTYLKPWPLNNDIGRRHYTMRPEVAAALQDLAARQPMSAVGITESHDGR